MVEAGGKHDRPFVPDASNEKLFCCPDRRGVRAPGDGPGTSQRLHGEHPGEFIEREYPLPPELVHGKDRVRIRFQPQAGYTAGPVFGCRILAADGKAPPGAGPVTRPCDGRPGS